MQPDRRFYFFIPEYKIPSFGFAPVDVLRDNGAHRADVWYGDNTVQLDSKSCYNISLNTFEVISAYEALGFLLTSGFPCIKVTRCSIRLNFNRW